MDELALLGHWRSELSAALGIDAAMVDIEAVRARATASASGVARPAVPLTACLVGLATRARIDSGANAEAAFADAVTVATRAIAGFQPPAR